ncbi:MAG TPA: c-type cytochrome [Hyphomicrobiales bacterium]|nr:c-type cytochrome [Hyphomicrobiales bacterium]
MNKSLMIVTAATVAMSGFAVSDAIAGPEAKCKACHNFDSTDKKVGPGLKGIMGRTMGSVEGFGYGNYLESQKAAGAVWDEASMRAWIENSKKVAKAGGGKTKMPPQKLKGAKADKVIEFLKTL